MPKGIDKKLEKWTDEECLENFAKFLDRVGISANFIQTEEGILTHQVLIIQCGDEVVVSDPMPMDWPLQPLPMPDTFKEGFN